MRRRGLLLPLLLSAKVCWSQTVATVPQVYLPVLGQAGLPALPAALNSLATPAALPAAALPGLLPTLIPPTGSVPVGDLAAKLAAKPTLESLGGLEEAARSQDPADFARYAEQLFHAGRLAPDQHGAVLIGPRTARTEGLPTDQELHDEMALSPLTNPEREAAVERLFLQAGARPEDVVKQDAGRGRNNIYVVKKGRTDRVVVVGGHHDKVSRGAGTIDNWTGTTMVINLYQALRDLDTEATIVFIAFAREEEGLIGSQRYLEALSPEQRKKINAMVNLDTLAVDGTYSWKNNSERSLLDRVMETAKRAGLALIEYVLRGGDADSSSFRRYRIPAMTLLGASEEVIWDIIHSDNDTMAHFSLPHYKNAYLLTLELLKSLDASPVPPVSRWWNLIDRAAFRLSELAWSVRQLAFRPAS